jgi:hypothetical protein
MVKTKQPHQLSPSNPITRNNSKWIEAIKKEVDMLEKHACLQQVPKERNNLQPGNNNPSFKLKTTGSMKARPATIPTQPVTDTTKVGKGDTTTVRAKDERNDITCLFETKCRNGTACPYRHDSRETDLSWYLLKINM